MSEEGISKVARYSPDGYSVGMRASHEGGFVSYADYAELATRLAAMQATGGEAENIAREAAKPQVSGTGRIGAPHKEACTCRPCTDRRIEHEVALAKISASIPLGTIRQHLQTMLSSAEVYTDAEVVTGYKIKTGALHKLIGVFADTDRPILVPVNLPQAPTPPASSASGDGVSSLGDLNESQRAIYFLERFKREEKMLGPNEQAALDYAIRTLAHPPQPAPASSGGGLTREEVEALEAFEKFAPPDAGTQYENCVKIAAALRRRLASPVQAASEGEMVERAMRARIPGGSEAWHWLFGGGMAPTDQHRDWFRRVVTAALSAAPAGRES